MRICTTAMQIHGKAWSYMKGSKIRERLAALLTVCALTVISTLPTAGGALFGMRVSGAETCQTKEQMLLAGGETFGVQLQTEGVLVVGTAPVDCAGADVSPAEKAGIRAGDILSKIDGKDVNTVRSVVERLSNSKGKALTIEYVRSGKHKSTELTPLRSEAEDEWKAGVWIRDSTAGIGTVTFYCPETGGFSGLGHGICDSDTGVLMPLLRANVTEVAISGIQKGKKGAPGELKGYFSSAKIGGLVGNTLCGVFGVLNKLPEHASCELLPIAGADELREGDALIRCTVDNEGVKEYAVKIVKLCGDDPDGKNFVLEVTDPVLLEKTGGIVQGMSGSPVIQNGKLVGAVTHVLLDEPTRGYGICIGNVLAKMPELLK